MDASAQMTFLGLSEAKLLNEMDYRTRHQIARQENGLTFWSFKGKLFSLIKQYEKNLGVF